ncbi:MAG: D-sedoheptulose 7-phosphate isomerase [Bacillota bacterium]
MKDVIIKTFMESAQVKELCANTLKDKIEVMTRKFIQTINTNNKILVFGNGGSAADAQHLAGELVGHYNYDRRSLPAIALTTDSSVISCIANDYSYDEIFSRQIEGLGQKNDLALGISTSGNSDNVVKAIKKANSMGLFTIAMTGKDGGKCAEVADLLLNVPSFSTPRIQEAQITILHIICELLEEEMFGENKGEQQ